MPILYNNPTDIHEMPAMVAIMMALTVAAFSDFVCVLFALTFISCHIAQTIIHNDNNVHITLGYLKLSVVFVSDALPVRNESKTAS